MIARSVRGSASTTGTSPRSRPRPVHASGQDVISGRFSGAFLLVSPYWRKPHGCRFPRPAETIHPADIKAGLLANPLPSGELRLGPRTPPGTDSADFPATAGNGSRLLPAICRGTIGISGHDRPSLTEGGFRYARANVGHI
jgi:hypothetical protein